MAGFWGSAAHTDPLDLKESRAEEYPLHKLAFERDASGLARLLKAGDVDVNQRDCHGEADLPAATFELIATLMLHF